MSKKNVDNKVRTSITIDPDLLDNVRKAAAVVPMSVSAYIEAALKEYYVNNTFSDKREQLMDEVSAFSRKLESEVVTPTDEVIVVD